MRGGVCGWVQSRAGGAAAAHVMRMQIQATDMPKFHVNQYLHLSRIDSGIDSLKAEMSGHEKAFWSLPMHLYADVFLRKAMNVLEVRSWNERVWMKEGLALPAGEAAGAAEAVEDLSAPSALAYYAVGVKPTPPSEAGLGLWARQPARHKRAPFPVPFH